MKPIVTMPDPEEVMVAYLRSVLVGRGETHAPTAAEFVGVGFPTKTLTKSPLRTHVQVELELGGTDFYPAGERAQVRFNCWAPPGERGAVKDLASLAQGLVLAHPGDVDVSGCFPQTGRSSVATDPTTKYLMCWFLARVHLRATVLAS